METERLRLFSEFRKVALRSKADAAAQTSRTVGDYGADVQRSVAAVNVSPRAVEPVTVTVNVPVVDQSAVDAAAAAQASLQSELDSSRREVHEALLQVKGRDDTIASLQQQVQGLQQQLSSLREQSQQRQSQQSSEQSQQSSGQPRGVEDQQQTSTTMVLVADTADRVGASGGDGGGDGSAPVVSVHRTALSIAMLAEPAEPSTPSGAAAGAGAAAGGGNDAAPACTTRTPASDAAVDADTLRKELAELKLRIRVSVCHCATPPCVVCVACAPIRGVSPCRSVLTSPLSLLVPSDVDQGVRGC